MQSIITTIIISSIIPGVFFTLVLADYHSLVSEWQQVSLSLQDSS